MTDTPLAPAAPVCPRHPDRVSYVTCQRCRRPTCPQCQRVAAVGVQCVDCVAEGARTVRTGRTVFGGEVTDGRPVATVGIIGLCAALYVAQLAVPAVTEWLAFVPALGRGEPWRFLTAAFVHSPSLYLHILFNMYALWSLGGYLETLLGRARFIAIYLLAAIGGSVGYLLLAAGPDPTAVVAGPWETGTVGASGAVFGLFGAFLVLQRRLGRSSAGMVGVLVINGLFGFLVPNIAWQAHLGGFLTGVVCAWIVAQLGRSTDGRVARPQLHWTGLALVLGVLVLLAAAKYVMVGAG